MNQTDHDTAIGTPPTLDARPAKPIPVYVISALCILQYVGIAMAVYYNRSMVRDTLSIGGWTAMKFAGSFIYPTALFIAGVLLLRMKRWAMHFFALYLVIGVFKVVMQPLGFAPYLTLAMVVGIIVYCTRLEQRKLLG